MAKAETPSEFVERVQSGEGALGLGPKSFKEFPEEDAEDLVECLRTWDSSAMWFENVAFVGEGWGKVLEAMVSNSRMYGWVFGKGTLLTGAALESLPKYFGAARHVKGLQVGGIELTPQVMEALAEAALDRERLDLFTLVSEHPVEPTERCLEALGRLQEKFPGSIALFGVAPHGESLPFLVAMKSIKNPRVEKEVETLQKELFEEAGRKGAAGCEEMKEKLKDIGKKEESRLFNLLPVVTNKYTSFGGTPLMGLLPPACDEYRGQLTQEVPKALESEEEQVRWQLSNAIHQRPRLQKIMDGVMADLGPLMNMHSHETYFLEALVDTVLRQHGLLDLQVAVPSYKITLPDDDEHSGLYEYFSHWMAGTPAFKRSGDPGPVCYLYGVGDGFLISKNCGSMDLAGLDYAVQGASLEEGKWLSFSKGAEVEGVVVEKITMEVRLRDELLAFLKKKTLPDFRRLLDVGDALVHELRGPPKALARALEKDPRYLLDLNRWTFKVDSIQVMVLTTLLIKKRVEAEGGRITRFDNFHLQNTPEAGDFAKTGGLLAVKDLKRPPCLHLNAILDGWSFEIMVILSDFALVKEQLHKFYDITRAPTLAALFQPVFPPPVPKESCQQLPLWL